MVVPRSKVGPKVGIRGPPPDMRLPHIIFGFDEGKIDPAMARGKLSMSNAGSGV